VIAGRTIMGIAIGISAMIAPMYLSEIAPADKRGAIIFLIPISDYDWDICIVYGELLLLQNGMTDFTMNWRWMFGVALIPSAILAC
jgi:SP family galactose:H+ symporter-like MFS transporter